MDGDLEQILSLAPLDEALADRQLRQAPTAPPPVSRDGQGGVGGRPLSWIRRRALRVKFASAWRSIPLKPDS